MLIHENRLNIFVGYSTHPMTFEATFDITIKSCAKDSAQPAIVQN